MPRAQLPIAALPAWAKLNDVSFLDIGVRDLGDRKGFGLAAERGLSSEDTFDIPTLLIIPHDLVLSANAIEEHGKVDQHFRELLKAAGGHSLRRDALLFLLMQITISWPDRGQAVGLSNPWTEYVKMLPNVVPVPTMWTEVEIELLVGTSLESALSAKMAALSREFETLREKTDGILWCQKFWWEEDTLRLSDWVLVDAWYRSRCLELPNAGESMVPCLDMANHSPEPNAYYEESQSNSVALLLRPEMNIELGSEITISYDDNSKTKAEMLFSYGFIDEGTSQTGMVLTLQPFPDDPLGKAKVAVFAGPTVVRISGEPANLHWESPFLYLMCLNEEDGLEFRVLQQTDGSQSQLRVFWQGSDVTNATTRFEEHIIDHELRNIFKLRVTVFLQDRIRQQLERLYESEDAVQSLCNLSVVGSDSARAAMHLRKSEVAALDEAFSIVDMQKNKLLDDEVVVRYFGSMDDAGEEEPEQELTIDEDDFS